MDAYCICCGARLQVKQGVYHVEHDPSCPEYVPPKVVRQLAKKERLSEFTDLWPDDYPEYTTHYRFAESIGRRWEIDIAWPYAKVGVEVDGRAKWVKGGGRHAQDTDREKSNDAIYLDWALFRFSYNMLRKEPDKCVALVISELEKRDG